MIRSQAKAHPKTMAKRELEKEEEKIMKNDTKERPNKKEVIITVYVESPSPSASHSHLKTDRFKKMKPNPNSRKPHQTAKTRSYDRRAHLLAYSQQLRTGGDSQQVQWPKNSSKPKFRVGVTTPVRLKRTKSRCRYQRLVPEVDIPCNPKCIIGRKKKKKKATGSEPNSNFLRKLRGILRALSRHCNKGSKVAEKYQAV